MPFTTKYTNPVKFLAVLFMRFVFISAILGSANAALSQSITYERLPSKIIEERLRQYSGSNRVREATIKKLFEEAGCSADRLTEQPAAKHSPPNVICTLPGTAEDVIVVGAHFDHVSAGRGVVDNWSGASLLPSLFQSLSSIPRLHTFVFISFTDEEKGLVGSKSYLAKLGKEEIARIRGMIDIDTLGLGPTEVWVSNSDPELVNDLFTLASAMKMPVSGMNVDGAGDSDGHFFKSRGIPIITLHSVTGETFPILHTNRDDFSAIRLNDYYDSYRLIAAYLTLLDSALGNQKRRER